MPWLWVNAIGQAGNRHGASMGPGSDAVGMGLCVDYGSKSSSSFNGSTVRCRGYGPLHRCPPLVLCCFNGSTVRCRGYGENWWVEEQRRVELQWVHGPMPWLWIARTNLTNC